MNVLPSTSVSVAPLASATTTGKVGASGYATTFCIRLRTSCERGPGTPVRSSIERVTATRPRYRRRWPDRHRIGAVVLSDRTIQRLLAEGRIEIDPFDPGLLQPSSVDVRVERYFRVFRNSRYPYIDVKQ